MGNYYAGMINNTGGYGELKHHGILGQKWGVRRFQNADGSLTAAGRERYGSSSDPKELALNTTKWFGSNNINKLRSDMSDSGAIDFEDYIHKNGGDIKEVREEMSKLRNEPIGKMFNAYERLARNLPDGSVNEDSLRQQLAKKSDDYKYINQVHSNAMEISGAKEANMQYTDPRNRRIFKNIPIESSSKTRKLMNKMISTDVDADALTIIASSNYIEKLPKKDRDLYYAYLYCILGYDW